MVERVLLLQHTHTLFFFLFFMVSVENYLQFGSMETAQMWRKQWVVQRLSKKYAHFLFFLFFYNFFLVSASNRSLKSKRSKEQRDSVCKQHTNRQSDKCRILLVFGASFSLCHTVPAHHRWVIEGLSRLCLADDSLRHNNSHPRPLRVRFCLKVRLLIPWVITDHNGKHNGVKHCLRSPRQRERRGGNFCSGVMTRGETTTLSFPRLQMPWKDLSIWKWTFLCNPLFWAASVR